MIRLVYLIGMWNSETVVFVKYYRANINLFPALRAIFLGERFREWDWKMVECRHCMLWETQGRVPQQPKDV